MKLVAVVRGLLLEQPNFRIAVFPGATRHDDGAGDAVGAGDVVDVERPPVAQQNVVPQGVDKLQAPERIRPEASVPRLVADDRLAVLRALGSVAVTRRKNSAVVALGDEQQVLKDEFHAPGEILSFRGRVFPAARAKAPSLLDPVGVVRGQVDPRIHPSPAEEALQHLWTLGLTGDDDLRLTVRERRGVASGVDAAGVEMGHTHSGHSGGIRTIGLDVRREAVGPGPVFYEDAAGAGALHVGETASSDERPSAGCRVLNRVPLVHIRRLVRDAGHVH